MGWIKTNWVNVIGSSTNKKAINANSSFLGDIDCNTTYKYMSLALRIAISFGSSPDGNALFKVYCIDKHGANEVDTTPLYAQEIIAKSNSEQIITIPDINVSAIDSIRIEILNKDSADQIFSWVSFKAGYAINLLESIDENVKITPNDRSAGYLKDKITGIEGKVIVTEQNDGSLELLNIDVRNDLSLWNANKIKDVNVDDSEKDNNHLIVYSESTDTLVYRDIKEIEGDKVRISPNDTTLGFLAEKIVGTERKISFVELNNGSNEQIQINIGNDVFDKSINTLDNISNGLIYSKVKEEDLDDGRVKQVKAVVSSNTVSGDQLFEHINSVENPHDVTKTQVGLGNVDNIQQIPLSEKGQPNGVATLDLTGKVPASQLNLSNLVYKGIWNAETNTPILGNNGVGGAKGWYYKVGVSGSTLIDGISDWEAGDWIIHNGTVWEKNDNTDQVSSVAGKQGAVVLVASDITDFDTEVSNNTDVAANTVTRYKAKISANDSTTDYIKNKLIGTVGKVVITENNDGANENLQFNIGTHVFDKTVNTLDHVTDGAVYAKVKGSELLDGQVLRIRAVVGSADITGDQIKTHIDTVNDNPHNVKGNEIPLIVSSFNKYLSAADNTVQKALDTLDNHLHVASDITDFDIEVSNNTDVVANTATRYKAKISANDSTTDYIKNKLIGTANKITIVENNDGANENLQFNIGSHVFDKTVDTLDNVTDGSTYAKIKNSELLEGQVSRIRAVTGNVNITGDQIKTHIDTVNGNPHNVKSSEVGVVTTAFSNKLSISENNIQLALEKLDDHNHIAEEITDFDIEVSNNTNVAANTANRHNHSNKAQLDLITDGDHDVRIDNPHNVLATQITDFDIEVSNNTDVAANTANRHNHSNKAQLDLITDGDHDVRIDNPHNVTKTQVGLGNVNNTQQIPLSEKGQPNGVATLDLTGKVPASQLNLSNLDYKGVWNAETNTPILGNDGLGGAKGWYYKVSVAGSTLIDGINDWQVGDWIIHNGTIWEKNDNTDQVSSVAGKQGAVVLVASDITDFDNEVSNNADVADNTATRYKAKISANDSTTDYIGNKLIGTINRVEIIENNDGLNENLQFDVGSHIFDKTIDTLDDVLDGTAYAKIRSVELSDGQVARIRAVAGNVNITGDQIKNHIDRIDNPHNVLAIQISDFDIEVSNNADVAANTATRYKAKISANDSTTDYIKNKLIGTVGKITITENNDGANENLQFNIGSHVFDKTVDILDNVEDGTTYAKVRSVELSDGQIARIRAVIGNVNITGDQIKTHFDTVNGNPHNVKGSEIPLVVASFNKYLSAADNTVQKALDTLDNHLHIASDITDFDIEVSNNADVSANTATRYKAKISANDSTTDYVKNKLIGTANKITIIENNDGANENLQFNIGSHVFDKTVDTLDNVEDGTTYAKVRSVDITNSQVNKIRAVTANVDISGDVINSHLINTGNPHSVTKSQVGLSEVTNDAQLKRAAADFNSFTEKLDPVGDDILLIEDSQNSFNKRKIKISNLPKIEYNFFADQLDSPVNSDWAVNALAPASVDSTNSAIIIRRFDDTTEEGVGFILRIPEGYSNINFTLVSKPQTAPASTQGVVPRLYVREIPLNAAVEGWSEGVNFSTIISIPNNIYFQYTTQSFAYSTLGLIAGRIAQFELTRLGSAVEDTLVGDWHLLEIRVWFS